MIAHDMINESVKSNFLLLPAVLLVELVRVLDHCSQLFRMSEQVAESLNERFNVPGFDKYHHCLIEIRLNGCCSACNRRYTEEDILKEFRRQHVSGEVVIQDWYHP